MDGLSLRGIHKFFGAVETIKGVDLDVASGEFVVFVGPSGCGKSTLLRMVSGLESVTSGTITINGRDVTRVAPAKRGVAMVFQSYALFPHMTVAENISFGLRLSGTSKQEVDRRVRDVADTLQITPLLERRPKQLSGGQRQRVAIGRAIIRNPEVFLFDEPLSNLDAALRVQMRLEIAHLHHQIGATMVYVTHDQIEAMTLADRIVVLNEGRIEQVGSPIDLYGAPANKFVAQFIGSPRMNFFSARVETVAGERKLALGTRTIALGDDISAREGDAITLGIRPEHLCLTDTSGHLFEGDVDFVERLGNETIAYLSTPGSNEPIAVRVPAMRDLAPDQRVPVGLTEGHIHLFANSGASLGRLELGGAGAHGV